MSVRTLSKGGTQLSHASLKGLLMKTGSVPTQVGVTMTHEIQGVGPVVKGAGAAGRVADIG